MVKLAGDRLVGGSYEPLPIVTLDGDIPGCVNYVVVRTLGRGASS